MALTYISYIPEEDFTKIIKELIGRPLSINPDRKVSGIGRSQAFGNVRRMSYRPWVSRNTWDRPELWAHILEFAKKHNITEYDGVTVNINYTSQPHYDKGNLGNSFIVGFGDYTGGELCIKDSEVNIRHALYSFDGSKIEHWNKEHIGTKYSLVFYKLLIPERFPLKLPTSEVIIKDDNSWLKIYDIDGAEYLYRKSKRLTLKEPVITCTHAGPIGPGLKSKVL